MPQAQPNAQSAIQSATPRRVTVILHRNGGGLEFANHDGGDDLEIRIICVEEDKSALLDYLYHAEEPPCAGLRPFAVTDTIAARPEPGVHFEDYTNAADRYDRDEPQSEPPPDDGTEA